MPSIAVNIYDTYRKSLFNGSAFNIETPGGNGVKCMLVSSAYTPNQNTHEFKSDVTGEVTGTGYTAGGNVMANGTVTLDGSGNVVADFDDPAPWAPDDAGFSTARRAIIYLDTGTAGTSRLVAYTDDFGVDQGNVYGQFSFVLDTSGFLTSARV